MKPTLTKACACACLLLTSSLLGSPEEFASPTISVGVVVSDMHRSLEFYTNVVGMVQTGSFDVDESFSKRSGLADGTPLHVKVLRLAESEDATQWKLLTFGNKAKKQNNEYIHSHTGMQYITIMVKNLTPFLQRIREHKVKLLGETPIPLGAENYFVLIQDPDGTFVELIGPMK